MRAFLFVLLVSVVLALGLYVAPGLGDTGTPGNVLINGRPHGHLIPLGGESRLTLLPENLRMARQYYRRNRARVLQGYLAVHGPVPPPSYPSDGSGGWVVIGSGCMVPGMTSPCYDTGCRYGTCYCDSYGHWRFIG